MTHPRPGLIIIGIAALFVTLATTSLLTDPPIWQDEVIYADVAANIANHQGSGTRLWQGLIPGVETHALWMPPGLFWLLTLWFKVTPTSITAQRCLSLLAGTAILVIIAVLLYKLVNRKTKWTILLPLVALATDYQYLRATRLSRPEIFILLFVLLGILFLIRAKNKLELSVAGLTAGVSVLFHPLAVAFVIPGMMYVWQNGTKKNRGFRMIGYGLAYFLPIILWFLSIPKEWSLWWTQTSLAIARKGQEAPWIFWAYREDPHWLWLYIGLGLLTVFVVSHLLKLKNHVSRLVAMNIMVGWCLSIFGRMLWYSVYPLPFLYLGLAIVLNTPPSNNRLRQIAVITLVINIWFGYSVYQNNQLHQGDYAGYAAAVANVIPDNATVFLSALPDPYFGLIHAKKIKLYEYPVLAAPLKNYRDILDQSDYIVYTRSYNQPVFGNVLEDYVKQNTAAYLTTDTRYGYSAYVVKLKPKSERR